MADRASVTEFLARFENVKKQYFARSKPRVDSNGDEYISPYADKGVLAKMFEENMNLEVPLHPNEPPIPFGERRDWQVGEWWKIPPHQRPG